jgi:hypothetical protein
MDRAIARPRYKLSDREIAFIERCEGSVRKVARLIGCSKSSVDRVRQRLYNRRIADWDAEDGEEQDTCEVQDTIAFERLETPRRCPEHGLTHVWPCVSCQAANSRYE